MAVNPVSNKEQQSISLQTEQLVDASFASNFAQVVIYLQSHFSKLLEKLKREAHEPNRQIYNI